MSCTLVAFASVDRNDPPLRSTSEMEGRAPVGGRGVAGHVTVMVRRAESGVTPPSQRRTVPLEARGFRTGDFPSQ